LVATFNLLHPAREGFNARVSVRSADGEREFALARFPGQSSVVDTIFPPFPSVDPKFRLVASSGTGRTTTGEVPFAPQASWAWHRDGFWVTGDGAEYRIFLISERGDTLRIIERGVPPVPVRPEEAEELRSSVSERMARTQPGWQWNGPAIPREKPYYSLLTVSADGRIWVRRHVPAQTLESNPQGRTSAQPAPTPPTWYEPAVYDVFEVDGRFLGEVRLPQDVAPTPLAASRNHVWLSTMGALGVPQVLRYSIRFPT
jgi:hypothetical protein